MNEILLAKYGELALKGLNKSSFESALLKSIRKRCETCGAFKVYKAQSTIYIEPQDEQSDIEKALFHLKRIFGISAINRCLIVEKDFEKICEGANSYLSEQLQNAKTFKVSAKRADKKFPLDSMELSKQLGGYLLSKFPHLKVSVKNPEINVVVEVRDYAAYIHSGKIQASGGMPTGSSGRGMLMLSGGIDSPVAGYMMAKRGLDLCGLHFMSPPYTSDRAFEKVKALAGKLSLYTGTFALVSIPFTDIQLEIGKKCPEELFTILMRRSMVRIANIVAQKEFCQALVTGESLAQVASQTVMAIACTDQAAEIPIFRPLIGMDKTEIVDIARKIDTFETSILPYEDCCTVFTPKHPKTKPKLENVLQAEQLYDYETLEQQASEQLKIDMFHFSKIDN